MLLNSNVKYYLKKIVTSCHSRPRLSWALLRKRTKFLRDFIFAFIPQQLFTIWPLTTTTTRQVQFFAYDHSLVYVKCVLLLSKLEKKVKNCREKNVWTQNKWSLKWAKKSKGKKYLFFSVQQAFYFLHQRYDRKKRKSKTIKEEEKTNQQSVVFQIKWSTFILNMSSPFIVESQPDINGEKDGCFWCGIQCPLENICSLCSDGIRFCSPDHLKNHYYVVAR